MKVIKWVWFSGKINNNQDLRENATKKKARIAYMFPCHLGLRDITQVFFGDSIYLNYGCVYILSVNKLKTIYQNYYNALNVKKDIRDVFNLKIYA